MKRIFLLVLAIGGYLAFRRYTEEKGGYEATAAAEPFSSESLSDDGAAVAAPAESTAAPPAESTAEPAESTAAPAESTAAPAESTAAPAESTAEPADNTKDTLERPTWLEPADGDAGDAA